MSLRLKSCAAAGLLGAALLLAALPVGGCGSSDNGVASKSGKEILAATKQAAESAGSVHVVGKSSQGRLRTSLDLTLTGDGGRGTLTLLGASFEVVRVGETVYVKGDSEFYLRLGAVVHKAIHVPAGTWLRGSVNAGPLAPLAPLVDLRHELDRLLSTPGPVTKGAVRKIAEQKAIELKEKTKVYEGALYVATTGKPYPIEQIKSGGRERGLTSYSQWDEPVSLAAPSPAVDISSLKG